MSSAQEPSASEAPVKNKTKKTKAAAKETTTKTTKKAKETTTPKKAAAAAEKKPKKASARPVGVEGDAVAKPAFGGYTRKKGDTRKLEKKTRRRARFLQSSPGAKTVYVTTNRAERMVKRTLDEIFEKTPSTSTAPTKRHMTTKNTPRLAVTVALRILLRFIEESDVARKLDESKVLMPRHQQAALDSLQRQFVLPRAIQLPYRTAPPPLTHDE